MATAHRTLIARNAESFSFIYQETIDRFEDVRFFDPETEVPELTDIDLLYLPGGYPEKHLEALVKNEACRKAIKAYAEQGGRIVSGGFKPCWIFKFKTDLPVAPFESDPVRDIITVPAFLGVWYTVF